MARDHLKELRKAQKLSQSALAALTGLTSPEISRIECGYRDITPDEAVALAQALKVTPDRIHGKVPSPPNPVIGLGLAVASPRSSPSLSLIPISVIRPISVNCLTLQSWSVAA